MYNTEADLVFLCFPIFQSPVVLSCCNRYMTSCCCVHLSCKTSLLRAQESVKSSACSNASYVSRSNISQFPASLL